MSEYIHSQIRLEILERHKGQLHVLEKVVRLDEQKPHIRWQIRNTVTGEVVSERSLDSYWTDVFVAASTRSYETIPLNSHKNESKRIDSMSETSEKIYDRKVTEVASHLAEYFDQHCTAFADVPEAFSDWIVDNYISEQFPQHIIRDQQKIDIYSVLEDKPSQVWDVINNTIHKRLGVI